MRPFLTVLTAPVRGWPERAYRKVRATVRPLVKPGVPLPEARPYPGHRALVRSVVQGLGSIGADFNFNPETFRDLASVVYAPANEALAQAIELKRRGSLEHLVAGPVNALSPREGDGILRSPEIDQLIVASEWVLDLYREDAPPLLRKIDVCPAGVDASYWRPPEKPASRSHVLIYVKNPPVELVRTVEEAIRRSGLTSAVIRYGSYEPDEYREMLAAAKIAVFLSTFETQGLAMVEAWSMNVATIVWDPRDIAEWRGVRFRSGSSCPYLTPETGVTFKSPDELSRAIIRLQREEILSPRRWVLSNMTDAVCAERFYRAVRARATRAVPCPTKTP